MEKERKAKEHITKYYEYDPQDGFFGAAYLKPKLRFEIKADGALLIEGNRMGLLTLGENLIILTQPATGLGYHIHINPDNYQGEGPEFILQLNEDGKHGDH